MQLQRIGVSSLLVVSISKTAACLPFSMSESLANPQIDCEGHDSAPSMYTPRSAWKSRRLPHHLACMTTCRGSRLATIDKPFAAECSLVLSRSQQHKGLAHHVLQRWYTCPQIELALDTAESTVTVRNSGMNWDMCRKHCAMCLTRMTGHYHSQTNTPRCKDTL